MKQLSLEVGSLCVESFEVDEAPPARAGTVRAREGARPDDEPTTRWGACFCTEAVTCWECMIA